MKSIVTSIAASSLLAALAIAQPPRHTLRYTVTDLGTLRGGTFSYATHISNSGLVSGHASAPDGSEHAVLWYRGLMTDIGTPGLRGLNSVAFGVNERGQAAGEAETSTPDLTSEDFCGFKALGLSSFGTTCLPFLWQDGVMTPLPTLGGANGSASQINNRGEAVGYAENTKRDAFCPSPQVFQFKPVIWANGKAQELPTFGDPEGIAVGINDAGQVVGASGICTTFDPQAQIYLLPLHALLWQNGRVTDLRNLGGEFGNSANGVNNQGQVVGSSDLPGDTTFHAFQWTRATGIQDLGTYPGDFASGAVGINDRGEVGGISLDANFNLRAVLWENGTPVDLNTLILPNSNSGLYLQLAESINSRGEIVGFAQTSTGDTHAYLAIPSNRAAASQSFSPEQSVTRPMAPSENARKLLRGRFRVRGR